MANVTITQLPNAGTLTGDELVPVVQNGQTVHTTTGAISSTPSQTQTFLTKNSEATLANSRYLAAGTGIGLVDGGALSSYQITLNGTSGSLETAGTGIVVKNVAGDIDARAVAVSGAGLSITNADGTSGNPTVALSGLAAALANIGGTGLVAVQGGTTAGGVQILGTAGQVVVSNGDGTGNPTVAIANDPVLPGSGAVRVPTGTTAQQPVGASGDIRYNTDLSQFEGYAGGSWRQFNASGGVLSFSGGSTGMTPATATTGAVTLGGTLAIANGGTNATTASDARTNLGAQETLVSGTNIKTVNGSSLLGSGDLSVGSSALTISNKTAAYTVIASDLGKIINCTSGTFTVSLTAAATLGSGFNCWIWNTGSGAITVDPNGSETIDGVSTLVLRQGEGFQIVCDGTNWQTGDKKTMRGYAENFSAGAVRPTASGGLAIALGNGTAAGISSFATYACNATGNATTAIGLHSGFGGSQAVTGAGAMALGGSYASGTDSFAAATGNNTSAYGTTGSNSVAVGNLNKASSSFAAAVGGTTNVASAVAAAVLGGSSNTASGSYAYVLGGSANTANGNSAIVLGGQSNTASQNYSIASGYYASAALYGKQAHSAGRFAASGDAQTGKMVLRRATTDATPTVLTADAGAASTTNQVILPNDSTFAFRILVVARRTDANDESAGYEFTGVVDRNANAASTAIVGTVTKTVLAEDTAAWDCNVTADTTNGGLSITVTGEAAKTIRWVATCWTSEVTG
jgi:hypothetical protein